MDSAAVIEIQAKWLTDTMRQRRLSAAGWARLAGVADTTISRLLSKRNHQLRGDTIDRLAKAAGVHPPGILPGPGAGDPPPAMEALSKLQALVARKEELVRELARLDQMIGHHYDTLGGALGIREAQAAIRPLRRQQEVKDG